VGAQWKHGRTTNLFVINYAYGQSNKVTDTNKGFAHYRHIYQKNKARAYEAFAQLETDEFARLRSRTLLGGNIRYTMYEEKETHVYTGTGAFYEREVLDEQPDVTDAGTSYLWRANLYFVVGYKLNENITANSTSYFQPAIENLDDVRLLENASLRIKLADDLDLKISLNISYESRPPQTVTGTDTTYNTGVEYRF
jgi:Protein of unknown function, DUF481